MRFIRQAGQFVGRHMPIAVPICVVLGVLFPQIFGPLKAFVPYLCAIVSFQGSLNTSVHQVVDTFRRPRTLLVILLATIVVMPVSACIIGGLVFSDQEIVTGIVIEYSIPVAVVSFMWIDMYRGNASLGLAAILVSTVIAPLTLPLTLQLLMGETVQVDVVSMVSDPTFMVAIPAFAGVLLNELTRGWGHEVLSPNLSSICRLLLMVIITSNSTGMSSYVLSFDPLVLQVALFILVFAVAGFALGLVLARLLGLSVPDMVSACYCVGLRNISSGAVIATQFFPDSSVIIPVMMGALFQQVLLALFGWVVQRLTGEERERSHRRVLDARLRQRGERRKDEQ